MTEKNFSFLPSLLLFPLLFSQTSLLHNTSLALADIEQLSEFFSGEFDNNRQIQQDIVDGVKGNELHLFIRRVHVPVRVPALQNAAGPEVVTRQFYMERYINDALLSSGQRIFNFVLKSGHIEMEMYAHRNASATKQWVHWNRNHSLFEDLSVDDLTHNAACNVHWARHGDKATCVFIATNKGQSCVFTYRQTQVYLRSEVNLTQDMMIQDEHFIALANDTVVAGTATPYVYNKVANIGPPPPLNHAISKLMCHKPMDLALIVTVLLIISLLSACT